MAVAKLELLEKRLESLEREMKEVRQRLGQPASSEIPWWEKIAGTFANDPDYDKAMELGRKYRESLRPKTFRKKSGKKSSKRGVKASRH